MGSGARSARSGAASRKLSLDWLGVVPFFAFLALFMVLPTLYLVVGAFQDPSGAFTTENIAGLFSPGILAAYKISIQISLASAALGTLFGFFLAYAAVKGALPDWVRPTLMTFSGVASNFAGVPLAFAFIATLGPLGLLTSAIFETFDVRIYRLGFTLFSFWGLTITYLYFQIPLMILIIAPAIDGLKREWGEAAAILGASRLQYWRMVVLPVLTPSLLGCFLLLFANAFGAIATAYALTGSSLNIVPMVLFAQIRGDVLHNPNLGYAIAFGMIVVTGLTNGFYIWLRTRAERWQR
ncbi:MAG: ABC transporter permease subunit [Rhizobiaceae bacterium]|nr:ABC transporter permease subunit [Rhizobiaceae bacterium]